MFDLSLSCFGVMSFPDVLQQYSSSSAFGGLRDVAGFPSARESKVYLAHGCGGHSFTPLTFAQNVP